MKTIETLSIEGPSVAPGLSRRTRRIEIDRRTGLIFRIGEPEGAADLTLGEKSLILPGLVDLHVHAREDPSGKHTYKEDFESAAAAAIHGGVVAFADMPNNPLPPVDDASYAAKRELARRVSMDVLLYAGIGPHTRPLSTPVPYKVYMGPSIGDLYFSSEAALGEALERYRGRWVAFHAEAPEVLERFKDRPTHEERRPPEAEASAVRTALELAGEFGLIAHICHLSTAAGLEELKAARERRGDAIGFEVTPHHLFFDLDSMGRHPRPGWLQTNPPIRSREDRVALLEAFRNGEVPVLASDHAPHSLEEKERGTSGIPHLDTFGPFLTWLAIEEGVPWETIAAAAAGNPGRVCREFLGEPFGFLSEGAVGSLTIFDLGRSITIGRRSLKTKSGWSPFEGMTFPGRVSHTVIRGKVHEVQD
jgi:dihydroorotase